MEAYQAEIIRRFGRVRRARGFYLYTERGVRITDLFLDGGASILGRNASRARLDFKRYLSRGLWGPLPTCASAQLQQALRTCFPAHEVRYYAHAERAQEVCARFLNLACGAAPCEVPVWRPCAPCVPQTDVFLVVPPFPSPAPFVALRAHCAARAPAGDVLFAPIAQAIARAFWDLARVGSLSQPARAMPHALLDSSHTTQEDAVPALPHTKKRRRGLNRVRRAQKCARQERDRAQLITLMSTWWHTEGPYLFPTVSEERYEALFARALDAHILLSPLYTEPSVLPTLEHYTQLCTFFLQEQEKEHHE